MLRVIMPLLNTRTNNYTMTRTRISMSPRSWKAVGIQARGREHRLSWAYCNIKEIADLAESLSCTQKPPDKTVSGDQFYLLPDTFGTFHGPTPEVIRFSDFQESPAYVADKSKELSDAQGYPLSEIAVLYAMKFPDRLPGIHVPHLLGDYHGK